MKLQKVESHLQDKLKDLYFRELQELENQKMEIVKRIIDYRIKHNLNQKQLAHKAGVSQQHISKIESGEFSNILTLEKVLLMIGYTVKLEAVPVSRSVSKEFERHLRAA